MYVNGVESYVSLYASFVLVELIQILTSPEEGLAPDNVPCIGLVTIEYFGTMLGDKNMDKVKDVEASSIADTGLSDHMCGGEQIAGLPEILNLGINSHASL